MPFGLCLHYTDRPQFSMYSSWCQMVWRINYIWFASAIMNGGKQKRRVCYWYTYVSCVAPTNDWWEHAVERTTIRAYLIPPAVLQTRGSSCKLLYSQWKRQPISNYSLQYQRPSYSSYVSQSGWNIDLIRYASVVWRRLFIYNIIYLLQILARIYFTQWTVQWRQMWD